MKIKKAVVLVLTVVIAISTVGCNLFSFSEITNDTDIPQPAEDFSYLDHKPICPYCGSADVAYIQYGLPLPDDQLSEEYKEKLRNKEIVNGGCVIDENSPKWHCNNCNYEFTNEEPIEMNCLPHDSVPEEQKPKVYQIIMNCEKDGIYQQVACSAGFFIDEFTFLTSSDLFASGKSRAILDGFGISGYSNKYITYEIVLNKDVHIAAELKGYSDGSLIAYFKTPPSIGTVTVSYGSDSIFAGDPVFAFGLPDDVRDGQQKEYTTNDVITGESSVKELQSINGRYYIILDSAVPDGCIGGPLTDCNGKILGIVCPAPAGYADASVVGTAYVYIIS